MFLAVSFPLSFALEITTGEPPSAGASLVQVPSVCRMILAGGGGSRSTPVHWQSWQWHGGSCSWMQVGAAQIQRQTLTNPQAWLEQATATKSIMPSWVTQAGPGLLPT